MKNYGYEKTQDDVNWVIYNINNVFEFRFYKPGEELNIYFIDDTYNAISSVELKAINEKVKELGWIDE